MKRSKNAGLHLRWVVLSVLAASSALACGKARLVFSVARDNKAASADGGVGNEREDSGEAPSAVTVEGESTAPSLHPLDGGVSGAEAGPGLTAPPIIDTDGELSLNGEPIYSDYVRLTHRQWENSVVANLRLDGPTGYLESFPADDPSRYSNNEEVLFVSEALLAEYQVAAAAVAQRVATDPAALSRVSDALQPDAFIAQVGQRFYRRPLTADERAVYLELYDRGVSAAAPEDDAFAAGAQLLLEVWMQAPSFLYRVEHSEGTLNGYEIAARLALLLTDTTPTDALLEAAGAGELDTVEGIAQAAQALLTTPEASLVFRRYHDETFLLGSLPNLTFAESFGFSPSLGVNLLEAANLFFDRQFEEQLGLRELLLSQVAFVNAEFAPLYDVPPPTGDGFEPVVFGTRRGVFAQLPFLMASSFNETPNAFRRGAVFTKHVLCQVMEQPQTVPAPPSPPTPGLTNRQQSTELVSGNDCAACHQFIDPFGYAFENFDGFGRERAEDNGLPVDTTGVYPLGSKPRFADSTELMAILAESQLAHDCYAQHLAEFSLGRALSAADTPLVTQLGASSLERDESLKTLVTALVTSDTFRSAGGTP